jgi:hypothetical protein
MLRRWLVLEESGNDTLYARFVDAADEDGAALEASRRCSVASLLRCARIRIIPADAGVSRLVQYERPENQPADMVWGDIGKPVIVTEPKPVPDDVAVPRQQPPAAREDGGEDA